VIKVDLCDVYPYIASRDGPRNALPLSQRMSAATQPLCSNAGTVEFPLQDPYVAIAATQHTNRNGFHRAGAIVKRNFVRC